LCLAAVGSAVSAGWRYGCALNSCQDWVPECGWDSAHDCATEYQMEMLTRFATSHELFPKAAIAPSVCYPWHPANTAHELPETTMLPAPIAANKRHEPRKP